MSDIEARTLARRAGDGDLVAALRLVALLRRTVPPEDTPSTFMDKAFAALAAVFQADRAREWAATIHFEIKGAAPWTVVVADGTCKTIRALEGTATCTINSDVTTWANVLNGTEKPERAFLAGRVTTTNLSDTMRFFGAFELRSLPSLLARTPAALAAIEEFMMALPAAYAPERGFAWNAVMHFEIKGGNDWTLQVHAGRCDATPGRVGTPTCVVATDLASFADFATGKEKPETLFMASRIS